MHIAANKSHYLPKSHFILTAVSADHSSKTDAQLIGFTNEHSELKGCVISLYQISNVILIHRLFSAITCYAAWIASLFIYNTGIKIQWSMELLTHTTTTRQKWVQHCEIHYSYIVV